MISHGFQNHKPERTLEKSSALWQIQQQNLLEQGAQRLRLPDVVRVLELYLVV